MSMEWKAVIDFWFRECMPADWFKKDDAFDEKLRTRFSDTHRAVAAGMTEAWRAEPLGRLAEVIVLDQLSRNMFSQYAAGICLRYTRPPARASGYRCGG